MESDPATRAILDALRQLVRELRVFSRRAEATLGLSAAQLFVLHRIAEHQPLSINQLAELTLTHQSSVSVVAQRLEQQGLVTSQRSATDARRKDLTITKAGLAAIRRAPVSVQDRLIAATQALPASDRQRLAKLLAHLVGSIGATDARPVLFFEEETLPRKTPSKKNTSQNSTPQESTAKRNTAKRNRKTKP